MKNQENQFFILAQAPDGKITPILHNDGHLRLFPAREDAQSWVDTWANMGFEGHVFNLKGSFANPHVDEFERI